MDNQTENILDIRVICKKVMAYKKVFAITLPAVFVISCLLVISVPRTYTTDISLAPEIETASVGGSLSSIASTFGIDLNDMQTTDAITPFLYPDLMNDNRFVVNMFKINVETQDKKFKGDYYTYLTSYQAHAWFEKIGQGIHDKLNGEESNRKDLKHILQNPYELSKEDNKLVEQVQEDISIYIDKKSSIIMVSATAQDPLICKTLADSVAARLQAFIIKYRTSKAQKDVEHYKKLMADAQKSYEKTRREYASFSDANTDVILESVSSKLDDLENDMQLKYNQYTAYNTQYQAAIAKLREKTPVFTVLKGANVPVKPSGPKRMLIVIGCMLFACFALLAWIIGKHLLSEIKN